jgi:hypothetical protein
MRKVLKRAVKALAVLGVLYGLFVTVYKLFIRTIYEQEY